MADLIVTRWEAGDGTSPRELARFFAANVQREYISSGEVTDDRALDFERWVPGLEDQMAREFGQALGGGTGSRVATARIDGALVALALVRWCPEARVPHVVLDDVVEAAASRGNGVGARLLDFLLREAKASGLEGAFLESGVHNERAHAFFERHGFSRCSVQMYKRL
jgi:ribosomal protein S18 acetylase RimI-like enzyme